MHLLCFAVISHDRPFLLRHMLESLKIASENQHIQVIVSDNSVVFAEEVSKLCSQYPCVRLYACSGASQSRNYEQALQNAHARYISFLHDDDFLFVKPSVLIDTINIISSSRVPSLFYPKSISFSPGIPAFLHRFSGILPKPYLLGSFPFSLPVFPCWVYPTMPELRLLLKLHIESRPYGKYSDITFVEDLLRLVGRRAQPLPYYYFHLQHLGSDSATPDLLARLRLILRTLATSSPVKGALFLSFAIRHSLFLLFRKLKSSMRRL